MMESKEQMQNKYNEEPVYYCKKCLSLKIMTCDLGEDQDYCDDCGSVDIGTTDIFTWKKMYEERYRMINKKKQKEDFIYGRAKDYNDEWCQGR